MQLGGEEGHVLNLERGGNRLKIVLNSSAAKVILTDLVSGETASKTLDLAHHKVALEGNRQVFDAHGQDLEFALMVFDQSLTHLGLEQYRKVPSHKATRGFSLTKPSTPSAAGPGGGVIPQQQYFPEDPSGGCTPVCDLDYIDANYYSVSTSRSLCCARATEATNEACSNKWCIGCCTTLPCDYLCVAGQYYCECSVEGNQCVAPAQC